MQWVRNRWLVPLQRLIFYNWRVGIFAVHLLRSVSGKCTYDCPPPLLPAPASYGFPGLQGFFMNFYY